MLDRMIAEIFVAVFEVDVEAFGRLIRPEIRQAFGLEGGKMWVESSLSRPPASHGEQPLARHNRVYK